MMLSVRRWYRRRSGTSLFGQTILLPKKGTTGFGFGDLRLLLVEALVLVVEMSHSITSLSGMATDFSLLTTVVGFLCWTETIDFRLATDGIRT